LKKKSLGPLRQGQWLDTSETKQNSSKERKPPKQRCKNHKESPLHTCKLPLNQCTSPWTNACKPLEKQGSCNNFSSHRSDRAPPPVRPVPNMCTELQLIPVRPGTTTGQTGAQHVHRTSTLIGQTSDLNRSDR
jgi:hypothetical protein